MKLTEQFSTEESKLLSKEYRGEVLAQKCPSREVLKHMTSQWGILVLLVLRTRMHRFSELRRAIEGVSERMLAQTLQLLEVDGLVERVAYDVVPPHVEYSLTPLGQEAAERVKDLTDWIEINLAEIMENQENRSHKRLTNRAK